jgi:MYXO-CTERM domain-containing protein
MRAVSRAARAAVATAALVAVVLGAARADAYCRTSSCEGGVTGARCVPAQASDCGVELHWPSPCVSFDMQKDASSRVSLDTATAIFHQAFGAWTSAGCAAGGAPRISLVDMGPVACAEHEYNQQAGNANIIVFRDGGWTHAGKGSTLALTTVTFNLDNGEIYDADMELNSAEIEFTTGDTNVQFDLLSVATHECGHFLGLSHSPLPDATMYADYKPHSTALRSLSDDDTAAICAVYPPGEAIPASCDATPRHGFSSACADATPDDTSAGGCCTVAPGKGGEGATGALALLVLGALAVGARRRR